MMNLCIVVLIAAVLFLISRFGIVIKIFRYFRHDDNEVLVSEGSQNLTKFQEGDVLELENETEGKNQVFVFQGYSRFSKNQVNVFEGTPDETYIEEEKNLKIADGSRNFGKGEAVRFIHNCRLDKKRFSSGDKAIVSSIDSQQTGVVTIESNGRKYRVNSKDLAPKIQPIANYMAKRFICKAKFEVKKHKGEDKREAKEGEVVVISKTEKPEYLGYAIGKFSGKGESYYFPLGMLKVE